MTQLEQQQEMTSRLELRIEELREVQRLIKVGPTAVPESGRQKEDTSRLEARMENMHKEFVTAQETTNCYVLAGQETTNQLQKQQELISKLEIKLEDLRSDVAGSCPRRASMQIVMGQPP